MGGMRLMETNSELLEMFWLVVKLEKEEEQLINFAWNGYFGDNGCSRCWLGDEYGGIVKMEMSSSRVDLKIKMTLGTWQ